MHTSAVAQFAGEEAWKELVQYEGVRFLYVFYPRADSVNDGVVLMLQNQNDYSIEYSFTIIFESSEDTVFADASGSLLPLEMKTGDAANLFWIPFDDGRSIAALRMRNYRVVRTEEGGSADQ